jgi:hypothetical protein
MTPPKNGNADIPSWVSMLDQTIKAYSIPQATIERYSKREDFHLPTQSPPKKAAFERLIRSEVSDPPPADIIASTEGLWLAD